MKTRSRFASHGSGPNDFYYVSDGKIRKRSVNGGEAQTIPFKATMQVTRANNAYVHRKRDFDSTTPRKALGIVRPMISPDGTKVAFAAPRRYLGHAGWRQAREHHERQISRYRSSLVARRSPVGLLLG